MQQNVQKVSRAITLGFVLVLAGAGAGIFCYIVFSVLGTGIALGTGGLLSLGILFYTFFWLDLPDGKHKDELLSAYFHALVPEAASNPQAFASRIQRITNQSTWFSILLIFSTLEASAGIAVVTYSVMGTSRPAFYALVGLVTIIWLLARSLVVKLPDQEYPSEFIADSKTWPQLTHLLEEVRSALGARPIHRLVVVPGQGCSVSSSTNRFGLVSRNTMEIGIYLPAFMTSDELRALFAHELHHISNKDTFIGFKSMLNLLRWKEMRDRAADKNYLIRILFATFAEYYCQMLSLLHGAVSKPQEFLADRQSVTVAGSEAFASMLYKINYLLEFADPGVDFHELQDSGEIPSDYFSADFQRLWTEVTSQKSNFDQRLREAVSGTFDTHPSFSERLEAAGASLLSYPATLSAQGTLKDEVLRNLAGYNSLWKALVLQQWDAYQSEQEEARQIVSDFDGQLDDEDACFNYGMALEALRRYQEALEFYEKLAATDCDAQILSFRKGICMLAMENDEGLDLVRRAAEANPYLAENAMKLIYGYLAAHYRFKELEENRAWFEAKSEVMDNLSQETGDIMGEDVLLPVDLDEDLKNLLAEKLYALKRVSKVYLLKKEVRFAKKGPLFIGFETGLYDTNKKDSEQVTAVFDEIISLTGHEGFFVYSYDANVLFFLGTFMEVEGALVYSRKEYKRKS